MKTFGTSNFYFLILIILLSGNPILGQCTLECNEDDCGGVTVAFGATGNVSIFCEGEIIPLENNTDPVQGFDYYVVDWADGTLDTFYSIQTATHEYNLPDSILCEGNETFWVCFKGVKECSEGTSCHIGAYQFTIKPRPLAVLNLQPQYCISDPVPFLENSCNGETYLWDFGNGVTSTLENPSYTYPAPGLYTVKLTVTNECGMDMATQQIRIVEQPEALVQWLPMDDTVCLDQVFQFNDITQTFGTTTWSITPNDTNKWMFTDTLMNFNSDDIEVIFKQVGTYTIRLTANNACTTDVWMQNIVVLDGPTVNLQSGPELCISNAIYDPVVTYTGQNQIESYVWSFPGGTPSSSTLADPGNISYATPGTYNVSLTISSECGNATVNTTVTIDQMPMIVMPSVPNVYCSSSSPDTLVASPPGGVWSGPGISNGGIFDPGDVTPNATHTLTYTAINGECEASSSLMVTVVSSQLVTTEDAHVCEDALPFNLIANPPGGIWSGSPAVTPQGLFNPAISGPDTLMLTYEFVDMNACTFMVQAEVNVQSFPEIMMSDTSLLCNEDIVSQLSAVLNLMTNPAGGNQTWTFNGLPSTGSINGNGLLGFYDVQLNYMYEECSVTDSAVIEFISSTPLVISSDTTLCIQESSYQLTSNLSGTWSGPGVNPTTGLVNLNTAGPGAWNYTFSHQPGTSCEQTDQVQIVINDPSSNLDAGDDVALCEGTINAYTFSGYMPSGGVWFGFNVTDSIAGTVNVSALTPGTAYTYQYCIEDASLDGCQACDEVTLMVNPLPVANFTITGTPCEDILFQIAIDSCVTGAMYQWNFGDGNAGTGCSTMHTYTMGGDFILQVNVTSAEGCQNQQSQPIHVTAPPVALFDLLVDDGCAPFPLEINNLSSGEITNQYWLIGSDTIFGADPGSYLIDGLISDSLVTIELYVVNGCAVVNHSEAALVHPYPVVSFGFPVDEGCSPLSISFGNATLGNPETWFWDLGNGMTSTDSIPPPQIYTTPPDSVSIYTVQLISTNACGADTMTNSITVYPPDVEAFMQIDTLQGCQPLTFSAHSFSTPGSVIGWQIFLDDELITGSTSSDPIFMLDQPGIFTIILSASRCGADFDTGYITVLPAPDIDFLVEPVICEDEEVHFQNISQQVTQVQWDLGDGTLSAIFSPTHNYNQPGLYTVVLSAISEINQCPDTISRQIEVRARPVLNVDTQPVSGCPPLNAQFSNNGAVMNSYVWQFGDGSPQDTAYTPSHVFRQTGVFSTAVFAYDAFGCISDTAIIPVEVFSVPVSDFTTLGSRFCTGHDSILTVNQSTGASSFIWSVNGNLHAPDPLVFLPDTMGDYRIELIAENVFGCRDTSTEFITFLPSPDAQFELSSAMGCTPLQIQLMNQSTGSTDFRWDFGDGNISLGISPSHLYTDSGSFQLLLIASHDNGCPDDSVSAQIQVYPLPAAAFSALKTDTCGVPMEVRFINHSTGGMNYAWTFGDGQASDHTNPIHFYTIDGTFTAQLNVTNVYGCSDTTRTQIEIYQQPVADFDLLSPLLCEGQSIEVLNHSLHGNAYCWLLDNQVLSEQQGLDFVPADTGIYELALIVKYNEFCKDTMVWPQPIQVFTTPAADFSFEVDHQENILGDVQFWNQSSMFDRIRWEFGDGTGSDQEHPFHEYDINRNVQVTLFAYHDNQGILTCVDSVRKDIAPEWLVTFFAPNAFQPEHGDSLVSLFKPTGLGLAEYEIAVYSPWGQQVWKSNLLEDTMPVEGWNGRLNNTGEILPQGAFSWIAQIQFVNGEHRVYKGSVTLLR